MNNSGDNTNLGSIEFHGVGVSPGIAVAPVVLYRASEIKPPKKTLTKGSLPAEWKRLQDAIELSIKQLQSLRGQLKESENGEIGIIDSHLMVLNDELIVKDFRIEIFERRRNVEWAVRTVADKYVKKFSEFDDIYLRERADDITDVARRLLRNLMGITDSLFGAITSPCVLVAETLSPSEALALPRKLVKGVALDSGSSTSHAALVIRAIGIPAVFGLCSISNIAISGKLIGLDGSKGIVTLNPDEENQSLLRNLAVERHDILSSFEPLRHRPAVTEDGFRVRLLANIENSDDLANIDENGAEGVGLFRTEYLWLATGRAVGEKKQTDVYKTVADYLRGKNVVIRVFDLGGDKFMQGVGLKKGEENPFLGMRSIRYLLKNDNVLRAQFRAILRANELANISVMLPMVTVLDELLRARSILAECADEIRAEGLKIPTPPLGIMVEVPAAALNARILAKHADFMSIGSNDLTQYTMAADRINERVAHLYQPAHPAVLALMKMTADAAHEASIPVSVCGEMAANPLLAPILVGMRFDSLSMAASAIPVVKSAIRSMNLSDARALAQRATEFGETESVLEMCRDYLMSHAPEILKL